MRSPVPSLALEIDFLQRGVRVDGLAIDLTAVEFDILAALAREPGVLITRAALLERVWGPGFVDDYDLVDLHVENLRRQLADGAGTHALVETVGDSGYRLASISTYRAG
jgi:DNA-binding response OmpR family regulator